MGGKHTRQQYRSQHGEIQHVKPDKRSQGHRHQKRVHPEGQTLPFILFKIPQINLQPRQEHDIQKPGCSRKNNTTIPQHQVKTIRPDNCPGNNQSQQMGNPQLIQQ